MFLPGNTIANRICFNILKNSLRKEINLHNAEMAGLEPSHFFRFNCFQNLNYTKRWRISDYSFGTFKLKVPGEQKAHPWVTLRGGFI